MNADGLIAEARAGTPEALGRLLELYRGYLRLLADFEIGRNLRGKLDASDIVQETFLDAHRQFTQFQGTEEPQFTQWLRQILAGKLSNQVRHYLGTQARDVRREERVAVELERSSASLVAMLAAPVSSPSQQASRREVSVLVADALARLPEDYRAVLILRHWEGLTFGDIGLRMNRSEDAAEKLWVRALARLRRQMGGAT